MNENDKIHRKENVMKMGFEIRKNDIEKFLREKCKKIDSTWGVVWPNEFDRVVVMHNNTSFSSLTIFCENSLDSLGAFIHDDVFYSANIKDVAEYMGEEFVLYAQSHGRMVSV